MYRNSTIDLRPVRGVAFWAEVGTAALQVGTEATKAGIQYALAPKPAKTKKGAVPVAAPVQAGAPVSIGLIPGVSNAVVMVGGAALLLAVFFFMKRKR